MTRLQKVFALQEEDRYPISAATNALPIVITTAIPHTLITGDLVTIEGVQDNTNANVVDHPVTVISTTTFSLDDIKGNADYVGGAGVAVSIASAIKRTFPADTTLLGTPFQPEAQHSDKCTLFVTATNDPTGGGVDDVDVRLYGRPENDISDYVLIQKLTSVDTWTIGASLFSAVARDLAMYPEMVIKVEAVGGSTNVVRAWMIH